MARILHFDCFSGISGDMTLGSLLDLGVPESLVRESLDSLELPGKLIVEKIKKAGIASTYIKVETPSEHKHRHLKHIYEIIDRGKLTDNAKQIAKKMFLALAEAEAAVHNSTIEKVHFHEVGAVDSIFDFVGCAVGFDHLKIDRFTSRPVPTGNGTVQCEHGLMPVPAPATALLLKGIPIAESSIEKELTTPTGAAILKSLVSDFGALPSMTISAVGFGAGTRNLPNQPNVLRLVLGESADASTGTEAFDRDTIWQLETNIDDAPAEYLGYCIERLWSAGALDVFSIPMQMKKHRTGILLTVLCNEDSRTTLERIIFEETGTLGIRKHRAERTKLIRQSTTVETAWGSIAGKIAWNGSQWWFSPEYESCAEVARSNKVPLRSIYEAARASFANQPQPNPPNQ